MLYDESDVLTTSGKAQYRKKKYFFLIPMILFAFTLFWFISTADNPIADPFPFILIFAFLFTLGAYISCLRVDYLVITQDTIVFNERRLIDVIKGRKTTAKFIEIQKVNRITDPLLKYQVLYRVWLKGNDKPIDINNPWTLFLNPRSTKKYMPKSAELKLNEERFKRIFEKICKQNEIKIS